MRKEPQIHLTDDMIERHFIIWAFITVQSETAAGISRESPIVSHHKESAGIYLEFIDAAPRFRLHSAQICFRQGIALLDISIRSAYLYAVMFDLDGLSRQSDDSLDIRDGLARRHENDHIASLELVESRSDLVHDDEIILFECRCHARSDHSIRISDEKSDE